MACLLSASSAACAISTRNGSIADEAAGTTEIKSLAVHRDGDMTDPGPAVEPRAESPEGAVVGGTMESGEAERCYEKPAALVEHALLDYVIRLN